MPVISICLSPGLQRSVTIDSLVLGEVNRLHSVVVDVAGKGVNVCRVLQRLGVEAFCLAQGGSNADEIMALAGLEGLNLRLIPATGRLRTCTSIIEMHHAAGRRVTELVEPNSPVNDACVSLMTQTLQQQLPSATACVIAGSMASGFPAGYQARLANMAREAGVPVILDLQGEPLRQAIAAQPAVVKINLAEFVASFLADRFTGGEHCGESAATELSPILMDAVAEVSRRHQPTFVLTRGANSILLARGGELRSIPVPVLAAEESMSPIGSGDAFLAGMLAQLLAAGGLEKPHPISLDVIETTIAFAIACAQSNARGLRPGFLEDSFTRQL
jgi:fructose-1-phosphate kinase PfkB-like protein